MADAAAYSKVQVTGMRETLRALRQLDPELRKQTVKEIRTVARGIATEAKGLLPKQPPMSGWQTQPSTRGAYKNGQLQPMVRGGRGWMPWANPQRLVKVDIGRQRGQARRNEWTVARIVSLSPAAQVFEFAGRGTPRNYSPTRDQFIRNLDRYGQPGRSLWTAVDRNAPAAQRAIIAALRNAEATINRQIGGV